MDWYNFKDLCIDTNGELSIDVSGDFKVSKSSEAIIESIMFRLKTVIGDFLLEPNCGASLEQFYGEPNSPETGGNIEKYVSYALTHDGFLGSNDFTLSVFPKDINTIMVIVIVTVLGEERAISTSIDLREGQLIINI